MFNKETRKSNSPEPSVEFPMPYEGVVHEILFEVVTDRLVFIQRSLTKAISENPELKSLLLEDCFVSPNPDSSLSWALVYYEIYSRSAERLGRKMVVVSKDTITSIFGEEKDVLTSLLKTGEERLMASHFARQESKIEEAIVREAKTSEEFGLFWVLVKMYSVNLLESGKSGNEINLTLEPLHTLQRLFHKQLKADYLGKKFN